MAIEAISSVTGAQSYGTTEVRTAPTVEVQPAEPVVAAVNTAQKNFDTEPDAQEEGQKNPPSESTIKQAVSDINKKINANTIAEFGYHEDTKRITIKIVDKDSKKVIREYPPEETLDMIAKVWELAGMFLDEKG